MNLEWASAVMFRWPTETWYGRILALLDKILFISMFNTCYWMSHRATLMSELEEVVQAAFTVLGWLPRVCSKWTDKENISGVIFTRLRRKCSICTRPTIIFLCVYTEEQMLTFILCYWYYVYIEKSKVGLQK